MIDEAVFSPSEKVNFALRELYQKSGYAPYRMSKFEEYDLYAHNKNFLLSDNVITFTDTSGKLMALKPDVTLSIIKNSKDLPDITQKVYYGENVYRVSKGANGFREIMQTGLECFGKVDEKEVLSVVVLAAQSLARMPGNALLALSHLDVTETLVSRVGKNEKEREALLKAVSEKNLHEIDRIGENAEKQAIDLLKEYVTFYGKVGDVSEKLKNLAAKYGEKELFTDFLSALEELGKTAEAKCMVVDCSLVGDVNYYNGIVFKGFVEGLPDAVLSGGQYDKLMKKMAHDSRAVGFAVYTDAIEREVTAQASDGYINVALPKGRLGEKVYALFEKAGFSCPGILDNSRKLIFENTEKKLRFFWVKPSDVAIYVERGAADLGVCGKDILLEYDPEVYELLDLAMGKCRMAVAAPKNRGVPGKTLRVATKFTNVAKEFYRSKGREIDIIHLNGSIELAPILGLSDVIVDIVETGTTLKENDLEVVETIFPISARLIANKSAYKFKGEKIDGIAANLAKNREE